MGGLFSSPSAPAVPDAAATAAAQGAANKDTAIAQANLNSINQITPYGNLNYSVDGYNPDGTPIRTATQTLTPTQQASLDQQQQLGLDVTGLASSQLGRVAQSVGTPFSYAGLPAAPTGDQAYVDSATDALFNQSQSRLQPLQAQQSREFDTKMANQGIPTNSEAYKNANQQFQQGQNDAMQTALNQAVANGSNAASQQFNMQQGARQQGINEYTTQRNAPLNEMGALLSGGQVQNPNFVNTPQTNVANTDVIGATALSTNAAQNAYNQQMGQQNAIYGAIGSLGGAATSAAMMSSDRRLKTNIRKVGQLPNGLNVYRFAYKADPRHRHTGVMAQEVMRVMPRAVGFKDGFMNVDYHMVLGL